MAQVQMVVRCKLCGAELLGPVQDSPDGTATLPAQEIGEMATDRMQHKPTCPKLRPGDTEGR